MERTNPYNALTTFEQNLIKKINTLTEKWNKDNISRTKAYEYYYSIHPEIKWAFLAGMVSRNAGWNMCDLEGKWMPKIVSPRFQHVLFITYERANWLIFHDAYPNFCSIIIRRNTKHLCFTYSDIFQYPSSLRRNGHYFGIAVMKED